MFGKRLAHLRKEKGLSQYELADRLGYTRGQIANYEQGKREPDFETLEKITDFFGVTVDYMLGRTDDPRLTEDGQKRVYAELEELMKMIKNLSEEDKKRVMQRLLDFTKGAIGDKK